MKKLSFLLLSLFLVTTGLKSQITIESTDLPAAVYTRRYSSIAGFSEGVDFSAAGPNHTRDFSSLSYQEQGAGHFVTMCTDNILPAFLYGNTSLAQRVRADLPYNGPRSQNLLP